MSINHPTSKLLTFLDLLKFYPIEVPIIQRDYAQGRENQSNIRKNFLKAIKDSLTLKKPLMLDFIYGSIDNNRFQPLDGQQRLTTLFLLHWYSILFDNVDEDEAKVLLRFSYETRMTSRDFCKELVNNSFSMRQLIESISNSDNLLISELIKDAPWFFLSWKNDPTINAMLNMLDDIHKEFFNVENIWLGLTDHKLIQFNYIELEHLGLTDDLYIKMNARGKLLTNFENLKASIEKKIKDQNWESELKDITESFPHKIDTEWADFFWKNFKVENSIDDAFVRFMSFILMINTALDKSMLPEIKIENIRGLQENYNIININLINKQVFDEMKMYFKLIIDNYILITANKVEADLFRHKPERNLLDEILVSSNQTSYTQKVLLYAQLEYFKSMEIFNNNMYQDWMRIVRNIIALGDVDQNGSRPDIIRSPQTFNGVINLISDLANGCHNILEYLANDSTILNSSFSRQQIEEERLKAKLIKNNPQRKNLITALEDTDTLRGRLNFIFYAIDYSGDMFNQFDDIKFEKVANTFIKNLGSEKSVNNDLRRALLSTPVNGEYKFYQYWWSFWNAQSIDKRKLINNYRELEYLLYSEQKTYIKNLLNKLVDSTVESIADDFIIPQNFPNWKLRLIKDKSILDNAKSHYLAIPIDESFCFILKSTRPRDLDGSVRID